MLAAPALSRIAILVDEYTIFVASASPLNDLLAAPELDIDSVTLHFSAIFTGEAVRHIAAAAPDILIASGEACVSFWHV